MEWRSHFGLLLPAKHHDVINVRWTVFRRLHTVSLLHLLLHLFQSLQGRTKIGLKWMTFIKKCKTKNPCTMNSVASIAVKTCFQGCWLHITIQYLTASLRSNQQWIPAQRDGSRLIFRHYWGQSWTCLKNLPDTAVHITSSVHHSP